jgi:hypothetical protein
MWQPYSVRYRTRDTILLFVESYKEGEWKTSNECSVVDAMVDYVCFVGVYSTFLGPQSSLVPPCKISLGGPAHSTVSPVELFKTTISSVFSNVYWSKYLYIHLIFKVVQSDIVQGTRYCTLLNLTRSGNERRAMNALLSTQWWITCVLFLNNNYIFIYCSIIYSDSNRIKRTDVLNSNHRHQQTSVVTC